MLSGVSRGGGAARGFKYLKTPQIPAITHYFLHSAEALNQSPVSALLDVSANQLLTVAGPGGVQQPTGVLVPAAGRLPAAV